VAEAIFICSVSASPIEVPIFGLAKEDVDLWAAACGDMVADCLRLD
jgi:hypothetical protein